MNGLWPFLLLTTLRAASPGVEEPRAAVAAMEAGRRGTVTCSELQAFEAALPEARAKELWSSRGSQSWEEAVLTELATIRELAQLAVAAGAERDPRLAREMREQRRAVLSRALHEDLARVEPASPELIAEIYRNHVDQFTLPERIVTRFLLLRLPPDADSEQVSAMTARLEEIRAEAVAGGSFDALARRWSEAENASAGGVVPPSPRGRLLTPYEEVAWGLRPGEVSEPVRLPDGLALVLLERRLPAVRRGLEEVRDLIGRSVIERRRARRLEEALEDARRRWPVELDRAAAGAPATASDAPLGRLDDEVLTLESLGLADRPPRLERRLDASLERKWLERLALARDYEDRPAVAAELRFRELAALSDWEMTRRIDEELGPAGETELDALYREHASSLAEAERRRFTALVVAGDEGKLRDALARARGAASSWLDGHVPDNVAMEWWGPIDRRDLGAETSGPLADAAFALAIGEISRPLRLDLRDPISGSVTPEGYVVLRADDIRPAVAPPIDAVRDRLLELRRLDARERLEPSIRQRILVDALNRLDREALTACPLGRASG